MNNKQMTTALFVGAALVFAYVVYNRLRKTRGY